MSGFTADHEQLANTGQQLTQHGNQTQPIQQDVNSAKVPDKAWGLLGLQLGLFPLYEVMLQDLEQHIQQLGQEIGQTGDAMKSSASAYQDAETQITQVFQQIGGGQSSQKGA